MVIDSHFPSASFIVTHRNNLVTTTDSESKLRTRLSQMPFCLFSVSPCRRISASPASWILATDYSLYALCLPKSAIRNPKSEIRNIPYAYFLPPSSSWDCIATVVAKTLDFSPANCNRMWTSRGRIPAVSSALLSH